eukprot:scaffold421985_cov63-Attheya_sp.AAC.2
MDGTDIMRTLLDLNTASGCSMLAVGVVLCRMNSSPRSQLAVCQSVSQSVSQSVADADGSSDYRVGLGVVSG